ncbi:MAG: alpha-N-arabinofuranosidase, partial [Clostridiales bacterium]|nr:alpha-N-arabinofuranosidase [Clostridiales bacterium]
PYMHVSRYGRGTALKALVDTPVYDCSDYEAVPLIDATATMDDDGSVTVFCVNRDMAEDFCLDIDLRAFGDMKLAEHIMMHHDDVKAVNTEADPMNVAPTAGPGGTVDAGRATVKVPALSWNVIRFTKA